MEEQLSFATQNENVETAFLVDCEFFHGPIELLLTLVKKTKIPIEEVNLADITDAYLETISHTEQIDLDNAAEFITVATMLIEIKAKKLIPDVVETFDDGIVPLDPETELKIRMQKYELFKEASAKLKEFEETDMFFKPADSGARADRFVLKDMTRDALLDAFARLLTRVEVRSKVSEPRKIVRDRFTVREKSEEIKNVVRLRGKVRFEDLFEEDYTKSEIITTFLALLELLKRQWISAEQETIFGTITVTYKGEGVSDEEELGQDY